MFIAIKIGDRQGKPVFDVQFHKPEFTKVDRPLVIGAALFGIGWGIAGLCPGPAIANLAFGTPEVLGFVAAMIAGMWLRDRLPRKAEPGAPAASLPVA